VDVIATCFTSEMVHLFVCLSVDLFGRSTRYSTDCTSCKRSVDQKYETYGKPSLIPLPSPSATPSTPNIPSITSPTLHEGTRIQRLQPSRTCTIDHCDKSLTAVSRSFRLYTLRLYFQTQSLMAYKKLSHLSAWAEYDTHTHTHLSCILTHIHCQYTPTTNSPYYDPATSITIGANCSAVALSAFFCFKYATTPIN
jgi:hypothetical protein